VVGEDVENLQAGDLVLIGSNLPQIFHNDKDTEAADALIMQFHANFAATPDPKPLQIFGGRVIRRSSKRCSGNTPSTNGADGR
jgi:hypothetical protein